VHADRSTAGLADEERTVFPDARVLVGLVRATGDQREDVLARFRGGEVADVHADRFFDLVAEELGVSLVDLDDAPILVHSDALESRVGEEPEALFTLTQLVLQLNLFADVAKRQARSLLTALVEEDRRDHVGNEDRAVGAQESK